MYKIISIFGDPFFRDAARSDVMLSLGANDIAVVNLQSPDTESLSRELKCNSLFDFWRVVRISDLSIKKDIEEILRKFFVSDESNTVVLIEEGDRKKYDTIIKKIKDFPNAPKLLLEKVMVECSKPKEAHKFVSDICSVLKLNLDKEAYDSFVELCGLDQSVIYSELQKLSLLFDERLVTRKDVLWCISPVSGPGESLDLYLSILYGNTSQAVHRGRDLVKDGAYEAAFGVLMKLSEAVMMIALCNGSGKLAADFSKKKRPEILKSSMNEFMFGPDSGEKSYILSPFIYKVAQKVYDRIGNTSKAIGMFRRCYDSFVSYRIDSNESAASARIDEMIAVMCRR